MKLFDKLKTVSAVERMSEEALYELVAKELDTGERRPGLWAKALAESDGNREKGSYLAQAVGIYSRVCDLCFPRI